MSKGRALHADAAKARESEQFAESLTYNDSALFAYDADNDAIGFSEGIACRSITLRVFANLHNSKRILTLAKYEMIASVELAKESGLPEALSLPLYNLAQIQEDLGEFDDAVMNYRAALDNIEKNPLPAHNRPSVIENMRIHLAVCEYKAGDKSALERAENALNSLEKSDEPNAYNKAVWISGGHMRIADALKNEDKEAARANLSKAKAIIDANPALTLRKKQWEKISSEIIADSK